MIRWLVNRLVRWAQRRCDHDPDHVSFDILERSVEADELHVKWCHNCGAVSVVHNEDSPGNWWRTVSTCP